MPSSSSSEYQNIRELTKIEQRRVLLDTNIIMKVEDGDSDTKKALLEFAEKNEVYICDTVLYECLRNLNSKRFRERHQLLRKAGLECLAEDGAVKAMFQRINWLYLFALRAEPWTFLSRQQNDLWIIAAGLANGVFNFLTTDKSSDFLPTFFQTKSFCYDEKKKACIYLHEFLDSNAEKVWQEIESHELCEIKLPKGYLKNWRMHFTPVATRCSVCANGGISSDGAGISRLVLL